MKLSKIILTDFKGFMGENEITLYEKTLIRGENAAGKTTIMDAHFWLFTDRNSALEANPDIRPNDGRECIPKVEEEWEINGKIVTIAKMQKKKVGKPDEKGVSKITLSNSYEINHAPKSMRDFKKDLAGYGFDLDNFLLLSHVEWFLQMKEDDKRKFLFGMSKSKTDLEIALLTNGCADAAKLLESYRMDEIEAMNKASKKKADEQLDAIPNQIIGKEGAKVEVDVTSLEAQRGKIRRQIEDMEKSLSDSLASVRETDRLTEEIRRLKADLNELTDMENEENRRSRQETQLQYNDLLHQVRFSTSELKAKEEDLKRTGEEKEVLSKRLKDIQDKYARCVNEEFDYSKMQEIEREEFDENSLICEYCGQELPEGMKEKRREKFRLYKEHRIAEEKKKRVDFYDSQEQKLKEITKDGNATKKSLIEAKEKEESLKKEIEKVREEIQETSNQAESVLEKLNGIPESVDLSGNEQYISLQKQIAEKEQKLSSMNKNDYLQMREAELREKRADLTAVESELSKADNNRRIDEQIAKLRQEIRVYSQKKADAEKILDQLDKVRRAKNELLVQDINEYFRIVRFELFEYFKNGDYKECVNICVLNEDDGQWYQIGKTANTALGMIGKMDLLEGFQKFLGRSYPVFVDSATEMDSKTMGRIRTDYQTVFLRVTDGELEVSEIKS